MLDMPNDADNLAPLWILLCSLERYVLANRVLVGPIFAGHRFIDESYTRGVRVIAFGKESPAHKRDVHRLKVIGTGRPTISVWRQFAWGHSPALDRETAAFVLSAHGQDRYLTRLFDAWQSAHSGKQLIVER